MASWKYCVYYMWQYFRCCESGRPLGNIVCPICGNISDAVSQDGLLEILCVLYVAIFQML